jgi:RimJ/RimL family protein N-acetyltransferase
VALTVPVLVGTRVRLEPLTTEHAEGLVAAADESRDTYAFTSVPHGRAAVDGYLREIAAGTAAGETLAFAQVRVADGGVVGVTRYLSFRFAGAQRHPYAVEIGGTWLAASAQRTGINLEAKLLMLDHAFDVWDVSRVDFKTDARNARSRSAIEGIGATFEGVLRSWQPSHAEGEDGLLRDTALFAIVADEWTDVRARLVARLG